MKTVLTLAKDIIPNCCMSCMEIMIEDGTLACNCDGCDVLPFQKCSKYKRLKYYGDDKEYIEMPTWV